MDEKQITIRPKKHYNTEEWRQAALHFDEHGRYTNHPPNNSPSSKYYKFWKEQADRCVYGYDIGRDWIPGYFYFYLNFCQMDMTIARKDVSGDIFKSVQGDRVKRFPFFWDGDYDYYHYLDECERAGEFAAVLKTRGRGYSWKAGSMLMRNYALIPASKSYAFAYEKEFLTKDGLLTKAWEIMDFIDINTAWGHRRLINQPMHKTSGYELNLGGKKVKKGYQSEIIGVTLKDDPDKSRGKRGQLILYEEGGKFPKVLQTWIVGSPSMRQDGITHGLQAIYGTGGTVGANFMGLNELFYNPVKYGILPHSNPYDKALISNQTNKGKAGFFTPDDINQQRTMDEDGNSNRILANEVIMKRRAIKQEGGKNPDAYLRYVAEHPLTAKEATLQIGGTLFPITALQDHRAEVEANPHKFEDLEQLVTLVGNPDTDEIECVSSKGLVSINDYPLAEHENIDGCIVIWEHPVKNSQGKIPHDLYIGGNDAYDHDEASTTSLGSTFIMNRLTRRIVAEYTGRPLTAKMYYENVRKLLIYYNAILNYENNWKGLFTYFENRHCAYLLADTPEAIRDKITATATLNRGKGTPGTDPINKYARELILAWLLEPVAPGSEKLNLHTIRSIALLKELEYWNKDDNFDRVSSLGMLMIIEEDRYKYTAEMEKTVNSRAGDKFWKVG